MINPVGDICLIFAIGLGFKLWIRIIKEVRN
jgi:hypothetical protein